MRLEWMPDTMTNIMFRPNFSYSTNDGLSMSRSATYKDDPYLYVFDPLDEKDIEELAENDVMVNSRKNNSISYGESKKFGGSLQINRKLNNTGRNVTLRMGANYGESENKSLSTSNVHLYQVKTFSDSTPHIRRTDITSHRRKTIITV